jgi:hypothetical protein
VDRFTHSPEEQQAGVEQGQLPQEGQDRDQAAPQLGGNICSALIPQCGRTADLQASTISSCMVPLGRIGQHWPAALSCIA